VRQRLPVVATTDGERDSFIETHLKKLYYDLDSPTAFSSLKNITRAAVPYGIKPDEVRRWLLSQEVYSRCRPARRKFPLNFYNVRELDSVWEIDLCDFRNLSEHNSGFKYFINMIDCLSRYVWAFPIRSKAASEVADVLQRHFRDSGRTCRLLQADHGLEFAGRVQEVLKTHGVAFRTLENRNHAAMVEKANQKIKSTLWKIMVHTGRWRWVDALPKVVSSYNHTVHSVTGFRPIDVNRFNAYEIWSQNYLRRRLPPSSSPRKGRRRAPAAALRAGAHVRVSLLKTEFEKGYTPRYSQQIYKIARIVNIRPFPMYSLTDLNGERLKGLFYREELLEVPPPSADTRFRVEKILERRQRRGHQPEVLIRWEGYDEKFDSWEPASAVFNV